MINCKVFGRKRPWPNLKELSHHSTGGSEENHENPQSQWPVSGLTFEPGTWGKRSGVLATTFHCSMHYRASRSSFQVHSVALPNVWTEFRQTDTCWEFEYNCTSDCRAMAHAIIAGLSAEARVRARISPCGTCGGQNGTGSGFPRILPFSPVNIIPPWLHTHIFGDEQ
jgi:hypothetical protein